MCNSKQHLSRILVNFSIFCKNIQYIWLSHKMWLNAILLSPIIRGLLQISSNAFSACVRSLSAMSHGYWNFRFNLRLLTFVSLFSNSCNLGNCILWTNVHDLNVRFIHTWYVTFCAIFFCFSIFSISAMFLNLIIQVSIRTTNFNYIGLGFVFSNRVIAAAYGIIRYLTMSFNIWIQSLFVWRIFTFLLTLFVNIDENTYFSKRNWDSRCFAFPYLWSIFPGYC